MPEDPIKCPICPQISYFFVVGIGEAYLRQVCRQSWNAHGYEWFLHVF